MRGYKPLVTSHIGNGVTIGKRNCVFVFRKCATSKSKNVNSFSQRLALCHHEPALSIVQRANSPYLLLLMLVVRTQCSIKKSNLALMVVDFFFSLKVYGILSLTNRNHPIFFFWKRGQGACVFPI